jgi:hypothetical protein
MLDGLHDSKEEYDRFGDMGDDLAAGGVRL